MLTSRKAQNGIYTIVAVNNGTINNDNNYIDVDNQWGGSGSNIDNISFRASDPSITLTSQGSGQQAFEDQTSDFGVSDGGYKNTVIIDEKTLEINIPFKVRPTKKLFDTSTALNVSTDTFTIVNHFLVTGQKVIYSNNGGTRYRWSNFWNDYYIIQLTMISSNLQTQSKAEAGTSITYPQVTGVPQNHCSPTLTLLVVFLVR